MDLFGSVDPYAILHINGSEYRTQKKDKTYTPEWDETFICDIMEVSRGCRYDLTVQINDWDATNKDDVVGTFTVPAWRMAEIIRAKIGSSCEESFTLTQDGKGIIGHDKQPSEVTVKICVLELPLAFETLVVDPEAKGPRRIDVTVLSARHLPKIDILTGTCDPYVLFDLPTHAQFKTETLRKTYSPDWNHAFSFDVPDVLDECCTDLTLTVMDYDMLTKNDTVGTATVPGFRVTELFRAADNFESDETFVLIKGGQAVRGFDGDLAVLTLRFRVSDIQRHVGIAITVLSATNLPCMEPLSRPWHHTKNQLALAAARQAQQGPRPSSRPAAHGTDQSRPPRRENPQAEEGSGAEDRSEAHQSESRNDQSGHPEHSGRVAPAPDSSAGSQSQGTASPHGTRASAAGDRRRASAQRAGTDDDCSLLGSHDCEALSKTSSALSNADVATDETQIYSPVPYCWAQLGSKDACTGTKHNTFQCDWKKDLMIVEVVEQAPLVIQLCDDDGSHLHDPMGEVALTLQQVASLIRGKDGYCEERTCDLLQDGEAVLGCNGEPARVLLRFKVLDWGEKLASMIRREARRQVPHKVNRSIPLGFLFVCVCVLCVCWSAAT
jgi:hypothetical protein